MLKICTEQKEKKREYQESIVARIISAQSISLAVSKKLQESLSVNTPEILLQLFLILLSFYGTDENSVSRTLY